MTKEYIIENFTANISVDEYISRFRDEKRFVEFCKQWRLCRNSVLRRSLSFRSIGVWIFFRRQIFEDYSKIIGSQAVKSVT